jgi:CheY-like chemotaxis protein
VDTARAGFNDYVTKPIKHNELGKMMMGLLEPGRPLKSHDWNLWIMVLLLPVTDVFAGIVAILDGHLNVDCEPTLYPVPPQN